MIVFSLSLILANKMKFNFLNNATLCFSVFRAVFGILIVEQILSLSPYVYDLQNSHIVLHYPNLQFIEAYSVLLVDVLKHTSIIGAVLLALGILPRLGALLFMLAFGYLFLIDMSWYNNHYYLWCLLAFLFVVVDTHNSYSIIDVFKKDTSKKISGIAIQSFKILISIVYLYAAIVKINPDWLQGYPATLWFQNRGYANPNLYGTALSYAGLFYDLLMPFLLWTLPRKIWVAIPYFAFHISNNFMFNIGMFPFVMMAAWLLFAMPNLQFSKLVHQFKTAIELQIVRMCIILFFIVFNIVFPLRFLLYEGRTSWHRQGYYFSWRMMLDNYEIAEFNFLVKLPTLNKEYNVDFKQLMTFRQFDNIYNDPYCLWYVSQILKEDAIKKYNEPNPEVYTTSLILLNQHPKRYLINPRLNLANKEYKVLKNNWFINI